MIRALGVITISIWLMVGLLMFAQDHPGCGSDTTLPWLECDP